MPNNDTFFTNDTGTAASAGDYISSVFPDVSLPATNNTGLTDNANTNPFSMQFANPDSPQYGAKTLYIKSLSLIQDRSKWVSNKPTYLINWHESFPSVVGYVYGEVFLDSRANQVSVRLKETGDAFGVNGIIRRVAWLSNSTTGVAVTGINTVDGAAGTTTTFISNAADSDKNGQSKYSAYVHAAANETRDLHDIRIVVGSSGNQVNFSGVIVYFENAGQTIDQLPGTTYVNKSKVVTTGTTLAVPTFGSSLGGKSLVYKTASNGYAVDSISATSILTLGSGTGGAALLSVSPGSGASFLPGYGLVATSGTSAYVGTVVSVSTDTLTMNPNLSFTIPASSPVYRSWYASASAAINASLMQMAYQIDFTKSGVSPRGFTTPILDPRGNYALWGRSFGYTTNDGYPGIGFFSGGVGFMQVDGLFGAAEVEFVGDAILHATFSINGIPAHSVNAGQTGQLRRTIFSEGGPGWNSFVIQPGVSLGQVLISRINLYQRKSNIGISFGQLAEFETQQAYVDRGTINSTMMSLGVHRRIYADQMGLGGSFVRGFTSSSAGGVFYYGTNTACVATISYYGKNFAMVGTAGGGTLALDGTGVGLTFNVMQSVATEGFHTVTYASGTGATSIVQAFDYVRSHGEFKNLQNTGASLLPVAVDNRNTIKVTTGNGHGSIWTSTRRFSVIAESIGTAISYADNGGLGGVFIINEDGAYSIDYTDVRSGGTAAIGVTKNATQITGNINDSDFIDAYRLLSGYAPASNVLGSVSGTFYLKAGDVIRATGNGTVDGTNNFDSYFQITKVLV